MGILHPQKFVRSNLGLLIICSIIHGDVIFTINKSSFYRVCTNFLPSHYWGCEIQTKKALQIVNFPS